jgi:hypothetical protein
MLITSKFPGRCKKCGADYAAGDRVEWTKGEKGVTCQVCVAKAQVQAQAAAPVRTRRSPSPKSLNPTCSECSRTALFSEGDAHFCREHGFAYLAELARPRKLA